MNVKNSLVFAVVVTLAGMTIDISAHLLTNTAVHFPYIATKFLVVAFTLLLFTLWIGADYKQGIVAVLLAVYLFYIYYRFTEPTLDRTVFTLDEHVIWTLFHWVAVYTSYALILYLIKNEKSAA